MKVVALFVDTSDRGIYPKLLGQDLCWGEERDARKYCGPHPVVAHPPCQLWVNLAASNYARAIAPCPNCEMSVQPAPGCSKCLNTGRREPNRKIVKPAWYPGGNDQGCFAAALKAVLLYGGVLEHPAYTKAWEKHHIKAPPERGWARAQYGYTCGVYQSAYGHKAQKATWLFYFSPEGNPPFELDWRYVEGTHQIGWFDRNKPTVSKREASATPIRFAKTLIRLAQHARKGR